VLQHCSDTLVVLVDYMMPRMNGIQMLGEIAKHERLARQHVYVLVTANYDRLPPGGPDLIAALAVRSVKKPFDLDVLLGAVAHAHAALPAGPAPGPSVAH
jgi:CheY-like chemotaxis protein